MERVVDIAIVVQCHYHHDKKSKMKIEHRSTHLNHRLCNSLLPTHSLFLLLGATAMLVMFGLALSRERAGPGRPLIGGNLIGGTQIGTTDDPGIREAHQNLALWRRR